MKTAEQFIKEYYEFDAENFEPQVPFVHLSLSDLVQLLNAWSLQDGDFLYVAFAEWVNENYGYSIGTGWYHKDDSGKHFKEVTYYTMQELFNIFRNEPLTELPD